MIKKISEYVFFQLIFSFLLFFVHQYLLGKYNINQEVNLVGMHLFLGIQLLVIMTLNIFISYKNASWTLNIILLNFGIKLFSSLIFIFILSKTSPDKKIAIAQFFLVYFSYLIFYFIFGARMINQNGKGK